MKKFLLFLVLTSLNIVAQTPIYQYTFNGTLNEATNITGAEFYSQNSTIGATYLTDRHGTANGALAKVGNTHNYRATLPALPVGTSPRTVSVWVKYNHIISTNHTFGLFFYGTENPGRGFGLQQRNNYMTSYSYGYDYQSATNERNYIKLSTDPLDGWYHYVMTFDGTTVKTYRNGKLVIDSVTSGWTTLSNLFYLGKHCAGMNQYDTYLFDDLKIYDVALTETQVLNNYIQESPLNTTDLVAYFPFESSLNSHDNAHSFTNIPSIPIGGDYNGGYRGLALTLTGGFVNQTLDQVINDDNFTVAFWQKRDATLTNSYETSIELFNSMYVRQRFYGGTPKDNFGLFYSSTSGVSDFQDYPFYAQQDGWNHHALVFKNVGGTRRLTYYINGDYAGILYLGAGDVLYKISDQIYLGTGSDDPANGMPMSSKTSAITMDELYFFNRALTQQEILGLKYQAPAAPTFSSCPSGDVILTTQAEVDALASCTTISGDLTINPSGAVLDLTPLNNITNIDGVLNVISLGNTGTISFLNNVTSIGGGVIFNNLTASSIEGFNGITTLPFLAVTNCNNLSFFNAFSNLNQISLGNLEFFNCPLLTTIISLTSLTEVNKINIVLCHSLTNLNFLNSLTTYIGPFVRVALVNNNNLTDITEINSISGQSLSEVVITDNLSLSTCAVDWVCDYLATTTPNATISGNATGCESVVAVNTACAVLSSENFDLNSFNLYPNPTNSMFTVDVPNDSVKTISVVDITGKVVTTSNVTTVDVSNLMSGIYMVKVETISGKTGTKKLVKS